MKQNYIGSVIKVRGSHKLMLYQKNALLANQSKAYSCEVSTNQLNEFWKITPLITNTDQILCLTFHHRLG